MTSKSAPASLSLKEEDLQKLLVAEAHIASVACTPQMRRYVYKKRTDGVNVINLGKLWEKLVLAARIIVAVENPAEVVIVSSSTRGFAQRACLKFASYTGCTPIVGRYTPGTFTNQTQEKYLEPRLLIVTDPKTDHQPLKESSYSNVPTIALAGTDSSTRFVDVVVPCNNKGKHSIGLMLWFLAREILYLRKTIKRGTAWDVMPDLFFHRDPLEEEKNSPVADEQREEPSESQPSGGERSAWDNVHSSSSESTWESSAHGHDFGHQQAPVQSSWSAQGAPQQGGDWQGVINQVGL